MLHVANRVRGDGPAVGPVVLAAFRYPLMAHFPNETPHVIANRKAARDQDDKGSLYLERPDANRIIVTARAPGAFVESKVSCLSGLNIRPLGVDQS